jgi:hypothetical protein
MYIHCTAHLGTLVRFINKALLLLLLLLLAVLKNIPSHTSASDKTYIENETLVLQ